MIPYIESFLSKKEADELFEFCRALPYVRPSNPRNPSVRIRKVSYATYSLTPSSRSGKTKGLTDAPQQIKELAARLSAYKGKEINYLGILGYVDECDHIGWHNHREDRQNEDQSVTVISLGDVRTLSLRPEGSRDKRFYEAVDTQNGSLYVLPSSYNATHEHAILDDKRPKGLRISINCKSLSPAEIERLTISREPKTLAAAALTAVSDGEPRIWDCHAGKKYPADAVYVGREVRSRQDNSVFIRHDTPFGNHNRHKTETPEGMKAWRDEVAVKMKNPEFAKQVMALRGKHLLCWCKPDEPNCHARVWLEIANGQVIAAQT